jgi:hypothetical protein
MCHKGMRTCYNIPIIFLVLDHTASIRGKYWCLYTNSIKNSSIPDRPSG